MRLELKGAGEPFGGRIHDAAGRERPFTGWLGLIAAIDLARADTPAPTAGTGDAQA